MRHKLPMFDLVRRQLREPSRLPTGVPETWSGNPRVLSGGRAAVAEILRRIGEATTRVEMRAFLWRDDGVGNQLGQAVLDAAERGVNVVIHKDRIAAVYEYLGGNKQSFFHKRIPPTQRFQAWFLGAVYRAPGSFKQKPNELAERILSHPNIAVHHERKRFDHSKLFIFDDRYITLGSMGIGDNHHTEWVDVMVELEGSEHYDRLEQRLAGDDEFDPTRAIDFLVHTRHTRGRGRTCPMLEQRLALIEAAERSLTIEMAYLGDRRFTSALIRAVKRGVDVTLVTASQADVLGNLNLATCDVLLRRTGNPDNLRVVLLPRMVHSKIVVIDRRVSDVGSANFTPLSHGVYDEINLYADNPAFAGELEAAIEEHIAEGVEASSRVGYRRIHCQVERAIVAYQSRKGGRLRRVKRAKPPRARPQLLLLAGRKRAADAAAAGTTAAEAAAPKPTAAELRLARQRRRRERKRAKLAAAQERKAAKRSKAAKAVNASERTRRRRLGRKD